MLSLLVLLYASVVLLVHCWQHPSAPAGLQLQAALVLTAAVTLFMVSARDARQVRVRVVTVVSGGVVTVVSGGVVTVVSGGVVTVVTGGEWW